MIEYYYECEDLVISVKLLQWVIKAFTYAFNFHFIPYE